jgi:hypothetical protein
MKIRRHCGCGGRRATSPGVSPQLRLAARRLLPHLLTMPISTLLVNVVVVVCQPAMSPVTWRIRKYVRVTS